MLQIIGAMAEFERALIQGTSEGWPAISPPASPLIPSNWARQKNSSTNT